MFLPLWITFTFTVNRFKSSPSSELLDQKLTLVIKRLRSQVKEPETM